MHPRHVPNGVSGEGSIVKGKKEKRKKGGGCIEGEREEKLMRNRFAVGDSARRIGWSPRGGHEASFRTNRKKIGRPEEGRCRQLAG